MLDVERVGTDQCRRERPRDDTCRLRPAEERALADPGRPVVAGDPDVEGTVGRQDLEPFDPPLHEDARG